MEKKKLLLVAVSAGVFLVIVISASILIFSKTTTGSAPVTTRTQPRPVSAGTGNAARAESPLEMQPATVDAADLVRNAGGIQNIQTPPAATAIQETNFYINGSQPTESYRIENKDGEAAARVTINVPRPTTAAVPDASYGNRSAAPARTPVESKPAASPAKPAAAKPAPAPAKPASAPAKQPAAEPKTYNDYWVQTGAFSAKTNAEGVKETLASKGITSIIENRVIDGKTWYQVRVGPYTSENEAKYWLALVQAIDGFSDSQVRQTRSVR